MTSRRSPLLLLLPRALASSLLHLTTASALCVRLPTKNALGRCHRRFHGGLPVLPRRAAASPSFDDEEGDGDECDDVRVQIEKLLSILGEPPPPSSPSPSLPDDYSSSSDSVRGASTTKVYILGTGLSDRASSLSLSSLSILSIADVVLYDALGLPEEQIRRVVPSHCEVRSVGKRGDREGSARQDDIDALLIEFATNAAAASSSDGAGDEEPSEFPRTVVRLKGGDPFLFGRTRTEIDALRASGIPYDVVPGLSSCVAGPHSGGVPLTDPTSGAQSFAVFSGTDARGRGAGKKGTRDWAQMDVDSLVFLMIGRLDKLEELCESLIAASSSDDGDGDGRWDGRTPCAVIQNAGRGPSKQRVWRATLDALVEEIRDDLGSDAVTVSPAVLVVGPTASLDLLKQ